MLSNEEKCIEKCNFYIKYFDKIKCYADQPYLVFSELNPERHIYIFFFFVFFFCCCFFFGLKNIHFNTINENSSLIASHEKKKKKKKKKKIKLEVRVILSRAFYQTDIIEAVS